MSKVSVVIPTYRGAEWIEQCVKSVLQQDYQDLEVIVVDDASPDDAAAIVSDMDDERIRLCRHEENKGVPGARNTGIKAATGEYIGFLDQDDWWHEHKLQTQVKMFARGPDNLGVVYGDTDMVGLGEEKRWTGPLPEEPRERVRALFLRNHVITITSLIAAECFETHGLLDEDLYGVDDYEFWLRIAEDYRFEYLPDVVATKRVHSSNTSDRFERMNQDKVMIAERYLERYPYLEPLRDRKFHQIMTHYAHRYADRGDYSRAVQYDLKGLRYEKRHPTDYLRLGRDLVRASEQMLRRMVAGNRSG